MTVLLSFSIGCGKQLSKQTLGFPQARFVKATDFVLPIGLEMKPFLCSQSKRWGSDSQVPEIVISLIAATQSPD
ncbi:MAG: hypothetical protein JXI33_00945 [Candidatus Aminicenantes bacterium]|nr:hypothetical protein [Candidatus Aminicenantes bacterium]